MTEPACRGAESPRRAVLLRLLLPVLLPLAGVLQGCTPEQASPSGEVFPPAGAGLPIALSAGEIASGGVSGGVPVPSRALIGGLGDLAGDGFVGWATWNYTQQGQTTPTYSDPNVFGENGTKVYAKVSGDSTTGYSATWEYAPTRYWQVGSYNFAAVLPASVFSASHKMDSDQTQQGSYTGEFRKDEEDNKLKLFLDFGTDGFKLGGINQDKQTDLMVAFNNNLEISIKQMQPGQETPDPVTLNFSHALAKININISKTIDSDITIKSIKLYGNHPTAKSVSIPNNSLDYDWSFEVNATTLEKPYAVYEDGIQLPLDSAPQVFIEDLLVFSEECEIYIDVTYSESFDGVTDELNKTTPAIACDWKPGYVYTYPLQITSSDIILLRPSMEDWYEIEENEDLNHKFE